MNVALVLAVLVLGLIGGALIIGCAVFFFYLLQVTRKLNETVGRFADAVEPLIKTGALQVLAGSASQTLGVMRDILAAMKHINTTVGLFNKAFFAKEAVEIAAVPSAVETPGDYAGPDDAATYGYTEEDAARREAQEKLRKAGYETDHTRVVEPTLKEMKGVES